MDKKYQIFISSTYRDLKLAREKVSKAILEMGHFPVGMELFGASNDEQWKIICDTIDTSDYYVVIMGRCLGTIVPGDTISYTQKEFRYAMKKGIPVLAFIIDETAKTAKTFKETDYKRKEKLSIFKAELETGRTVDYWQTPDQLATKVAISLNKEMAKKPRPGWIRQHAVEHDEPALEEGKISFDEEILLLYISASKNGELKQHLAKKRVCSIVTGVYNFVLDQSVRSIIRWNGAVDGLKTNGLIRLVDDEHVYSITSEGMVRAKEIQKKYPEIDTKRAPSEYYDDPQYRR